MIAETLSEIVAALPMPAVAIAHDDRVLCANQPAKNIFGTGIEGRNYVTFLRQPALLAALETAMRSRQTSTTRFHLARQSGDVIFDAHTAPIDSPGFSGVLVTFDDISHLEGAEQMRRDFVANVSHELRTPLTALSGFIETLRGAARDDPAAQQRFLSIMEREAARMNRLVQDLLSLSRVESTERLRPTDRVDVSVILHNALQTLRGLAAERGVHLTYQPPQDPRLVIGDEDQLIQVFTNLIENAVKYGSRDGGRVTARLSDKVFEPSLRSDAYRIDIEDEGEGIDNTHIPRLTERFYRVDSHRSRELGGTGLGLAIVKHILNRHRGALRIESEIGHGSRFTVIIPTA